MLAHLMVTVMMLCTRKSTAVLQAQTVIMTRATPSERNAAPLQHTKEKSYTYTLIKTSEREPHIAWMSVVHLFITMTWNKHLNKSRTV